MTNDICDPTFGGTYVCINPRCKFYNIITIVHTCSEHPMTADKLICDSCGARLSPPA